MDLQKIELLKKDIDFSNPELLSEFGVSTQKKFSVFSEDVLSKVRNKDTSEVGELLNELMLTVKGVNVDDLANPGPLKKLWFKILSEVSLFRGSFEKINDQMNFLIYKLEEAKFDLVQDIKKLEKAYEENLAIYQELEDLIEAATLAIKERESDIDHLEFFDHDLLTIQKIRDKRSVLREFEKRVHDLKLTKTLTLQTLPQIRLIQHNNSELVNKIQSSILNTIPVWKNQIILTLGLAKQRKISELQRKILETTNTLIHQNSELLKENTIQVAQMSEEGIVSVSALRKANEDLISVISQVLTIYKDGRSKRKEAEKELIDMERQLRSALAF